MTYTSLTEDLLEEFRAEKKMINEQVAMLDPLGVSLRKPATQRLVSSTLLVITEILCYLGAVAGIAFMALMHTIYPFTVLSGIYNNEQLKNKIGVTNFNYLGLAIYGIVLLCILLVFAIGRMAHVIRLKNDILHLAGKDIKTIVGQHLERKAEIETIDQKHGLDFYDLSSGNDEEFVKKDGINDIANPGFGD